MGNNHLIKVYTWVEMLNFNFTTSVLTNFFNNLFLFIQNFYTFKFKN
jgi:hypothetical protein